MSVKDKDLPVASVREIEAAVAAALRDAEASLDRRLGEIVRPLLKEVERVRDLIAEFEVSEEAIIVFLQTVSDLLRGAPLTVRDARRAGMIAAAGAAWRAELGPSLTSAQVRTLLNDISRQRVDELLRTRRLIGLRDGSGRRQFPLFQFQDGKPIDALVGAFWTVAAAAGNEWTAASWCVAADSALDGMSPLEWARDNRSQSRLSAIARQDAARLAQ